MAANWTVGNTGFGSVSVNAVGIDQFGDDALFNSLRPINGYITGEQAKALFHSSGLPTQKLSEIWNIVDQDCDGRINLSEFRIAMGLIRKQKAGPQLGMTSVVPDQQPSLFASLPASMLTGTMQSAWPSQSFATTAPLSFNTPGITRSASISTAEGGGGMVAGGVGRGVSLNVLTAGWEMTVAERRRHNFEFDTHDRQKTGYLSAEVGRQVLIKSGLDPTVLGQIWTLADVDKDGCLTKEEFCIAQHLVEKVKQGLTLPKTLPLELLPTPGKFYTLDSRKAPPKELDKLSTGAEPAAPGGKGPLVSEMDTTKSFEDKRKENFESGRLELERRRKALQEEQEKAREARLLKQREEEERIKQQEIETERLRQAEMERQRQKAIEIEKERERLQQQLLLQHEAEQREQERRRKEEWTKRRVKELEEQRDKEKVLLEPLRAQQSNLKQELAQLEQQKSAVLADVLKQKGLCDNLSATLRSLSLSWDIRKAELLQLQNDFQVFQTTLASLEQERKKLQQLLMEQSPETAGMQKDREVLRGSIAELSVSVAGLKSTANSNSDMYKTQQATLGQYAVACQEMRQQQAVQESAVAELRQLVASRKRAWEERQREIKAEADRQRERVQREEKERLQREEKERLQKERLQKEERERLQKEERERLQKEERERLQREERERLQKEERERLQREERERLQKEERERLQKEERERLQREERERLQKEERERLQKEERERLQKEERERLQKEERERLKKLVEVSVKPSKGQVETASRVERKSENNPVPFNVEQPFAAEPSSVEPKVSLPGYSSIPVSNDEDVLKKIKDLQQRTQELKKQKEKQALEGPNMPNKPAVAPYTPAVASQASDDSKLVDLFTSAEIKQPPVQGKPPVRPKSELILEPVRLPADSMVSKPSILPRPALLSGSVTPSIKKTVSSLAYSLASAEDTGQVGSNVQSTDTRTVQPVKPVQLVPQAQSIQLEDGRSVSANVVTSKLASVSSAATMSSTSSSTGLADAASSAGVSSSSAMMSSSSAGVSSSSAMMSSSSAGVSASNIKYTVLYDFKAGDPMELTVREGDVIMATASTEEPSPGWVMVELNGEKGWVPESYLKVVEEVVSMEDHREEKALAIIGKATALFSWKGSKDSHLSIHKGDVISVLQQGDKWWSGELNGKVGWFPRTFIGAMEEVPQSTELTSAKLKSSTISSGHSEPPVPTTVSESLSVPTPAMSTSGRRCEAIYPFPGEASGDLAFKEGDVILVTKREGEWWTGVLDGKEGVFPYNYVREMEGDIDHDGGVPGPAETRNTSVQSAPNRSYSTASKDSAADTPSRQTQDPGPSVSVITQPLIARVKVAFQAEQDTQLSLNQGELIKVTKQADNGWWVGELQSRGKQRRSGWFPANRVELLASKSTSNQTTTSESQAVPASQNLVLALYSYTPTSSDELSFHKGSVISVLSKDGDWWKGELNGQTGLFPSNYVQGLSEQQPSEATRWADSVTPEVLNTVSEQERKRQEAIFEVMTSERHYVGSLNLVQEVFFNPIAESQVLTEEEMNKVKVNWDELISCSTELLNALMVRLRTSGAMVKRIGDVLEKYIPLLLPHVRWCSCQLNACTLLQSKSSDPQFRELEHKCMQDSRTGGLPLSSFLLKPMQRVTKYPLLIKRILDYSAPESEDCTQLNAALEASELLCSKVNEAVRSKENTEQLEWLQTHVHLTINENLVFNSQTNCMGSRKILHWGRLFKVRGGRHLGVFLFNDFLMFVTPRVLFAKTATGAELEPFGKNEFVIYRKPYLLDEITVGTASDEFGPSALIISHTSEKQMPLKAESDTIRDTWVKKIAQAHIDYQQTKKKQEREKELKIKQMQESNQGELQVTVVEAADLIAISGTSSDPFCSVKLGEIQEKCTGVKVATLSPVWNCKMDFVVNDHTKDILTITVFDKDLFSPNAFLGSTRIALCDLLREGDGPWTKRLLLEGVRSGEIELKIELKLHHSALLL